ncbi:MAG: DJ-1/PfpI family protein [Candidatus Heimdallarchaeota archaeon]
MRIKPIAVFIVLVVLISSLSLTDLKADDKVNILMIFDDPFGPEYFFTRDVLEDRFGWNIKTTSLFETISPCNEDAFPSIDVDYTIDNLPDLANFDIISIMGGPNQDNLMNSQEVIQVIVSAINKGLIVAAWCRGVRVLAAADVINGKNVTGYWDFEHEYEDAGANYFDYVPPIIDGQIVTCVSSTEYRMEMCIAMATAVGVFENEPPELNNFLVTKISANNYSLAISAKDNVATFSCLVEIYNLSKSGDRMFSYPKVSFLLLDENSDGNFSIIFNLSPGNYTMDLTIKDIYDNSLTIIDIDQIQNIAQESNHLSNFFKLGLLFFSIVSSFLYLSRKKIVNNKN